MWLCLAVAVAALASVASLASAVDRAIAAQGRELIGGDLALTVAQREATTDERAALDALGPLVEDIATRAMLVAPTAAAMLAELTGADAAGRSPAAQARPGGRRPRGTEVAIGRAAAERLGPDAATGCGLAAPSSASRRSSTNCRAVAGFALAPPAMVDLAGLAAPGWSSRAA